MPPVRRRNLSHSIAESLLDRIRSGEVGVGERLPTEQGLMEEFGVGRNVIREAIQQLVAIGVLDVRPGRGTTVIGLGSDDLLDSRTMSALLEDQTIADLYAFRMLIEVEIAEAAASHADAQQIQAIADAHRRVRAQPRGGRAGLPQRPRRSTARSPSRATTRSTSGCSTR